MRFIVGYLILTILILWQHNKKMAGKIILYTTTNNQASNLSAVFNTVDILPIFADTSILTVRFLCNFLLL